MDDEKLRLITPTKQVLKSGVERKRSAQQEGKLPSGVGFWDLTRADIEQNNVLSKLWSRNKLAILSSAPAPAGWNARNEIKGLFRDYEDFLSKAKNPYELDYRKKLVLGKINYQRMLAKSGFLKGSSASMLACLMDPLTYVSFGLAGKLGANAVRTGALALGAGRVTTAAVHGAALTAGANLIETPVLRAIGASPDNPEYHVISAALGGALFGGFSGWIGKSLAYSRFRIEQGTGPRASSDMGFKIFEKADLAKQQFGAHVHPMWKDPEKQVEFNKLLHENIDKYLKWEQPGETGKVFTMKELGAKTSEEAFAYSLGWTGKFDKATTRLGSSIMDFIGGRLSNQKTLLLSDNDYMKAAGFKIFKTNYADNAVGDLVGTAEPLVSYTDRMHVGLVNRYESATRDAMAVERKAAQVEGRPAADRKDIGMQAVRAGHLGKEAVDAITDPLVRKEYDIITACLDECASELHRVGGFQSQRDMRAVHEARMRPLQAELEKAESKLNSIDGKLNAERKRKMPEARRAALQAELEESKAVRDQAQKLVDEEQARFDQAYSEFTLDRAKEMFGGSYMPVRLLPEVFARDWDKSVADLKASIVSRAKKNWEVTRSKSPAIVSKIDRSILSEPDPLKRNKALWKAYCDVANDNYVYVRDVVHNGSRLSGFDVYQNPLTAEMSGEQALKTLAEGNFDLSETYLNKFSSEAAERELRNILDRGMHMRTPSGLDSIKGSLVSLMENSEPAEYELFKSSARRRGHFLDFQTLIDGGYVELDPDKLVPEYARNMYGSVGMIQSFGDIEARSFKEQLKRSVNLEKQAIFKKGGKNAMERAKALDALRNRELLAMNTAIDHALGRSSTYWGNIGEDSVTRHIISTASNWNVARYLSDCLFAQLQDVANVCLAQDGWKTFGRIISSWFRTLLNPSLRKEYVQQMRDFGIGGSLWVENTRSKTLVSVSEQAGFWGKAEAVSGKAADLAVRASGVGLMDAHTQCCTAYMATRELDRMGKALAKGERLSDFQTRMAHDFDLDAAKIRRMHQEIEKHGTWNDDVFSINVSKWDDQVLGDEVRRMLHKVATDATMVPGAELSSMFRSPLGKMLLQFKSFTTATFNRMFVPAFERGTNAVTNTMMQCILLATMTRLCKGFGRWGERKMKDPVTGEYRKREIDDMVREALEDSVKEMDLFAWCADPTGLLGGYVSGGSFTPSGGGTLDALLRDSKGTLDFVSNKISGARTNDTQFRSVMRMIPFQNWWLTRLGVSGYRGLFRREEQSEKEEDKK